MSHSLLTSKGKVANDLSEVIPSKNSNSHQIVSQPISLEEMMRKQEEQVQQ